MQIRLKLVSIDTYFLQRTNFPAVTGSDTAFFENRRLQLSQLLIVDPERGRVWIQAGDRSHSSWRWYLMFIWCLRNL